MKVIWSGGGRYLIPQGMTPTNASIVSIAAGISVNWGGGDVVVLSGESFSITPLYDDPILVGGQCISTYNYKVEIECIHLNGTFWAINNSASFIGRITSFYPEILANNNRASVLRYVRHTGEIRSANVPWSSSLGRITSFGDVRLTYLSGDMSCGNLGGTTVTGYQVTTNTAASSSKNPGNYPSVTVLSGGWGIQINFNNAPTKIIPISYQPSWVEIRDDNQCPAATIKQCDHGATRCCFACVNGRLKLVHSFNKS